MEQLDIVDENGEPTGVIKERSLVHQDGDLHRTSHVWLARANDGCVQLLLQKRSAGKDSHPGCYDISSAGHIPAGCGYLESALRELQEELGITALAEDLIFCGVRHIEWQGEFYGQIFIDHQITRVYLLWRDVTPAEMQLQQSEVSSVCWLNLPDIIKGVEEKSFPNCIVPEELLLVQKTVRDTKKEHH